MKLHLGCGSVYLDGYVNIDTGANECARLSSLRPDLVARWKTTKSRYYAKQGKLNLSTIQKDEFVTDCLLDITQLPFQPGTVDEILIVQTLEHFTWGQVRQALSNWHLILKPGGLLNIFVPDIEKSIELFIKAETVQQRVDVARLIFGTRKSALFYHHYGYERAGLVSLLTQFGFHRISVRNSTMHDYPSFEAKAVK